MAHRIESGKSGLIVMGHDWPSGSTGGTDRAICRLVNGAGELPMGKVKRFLRKWSGIHRVEANLKNIEGRQEDIERTVSALSRNEAQIINQTLQLVRDEYTVMPRFIFHHPIDYYKTTSEPDFHPVIILPGEVLPLPAVPERFGYPSDNSEYLASGRLHRDKIVSIINRHMGDREDVRILDFGCATGRVLRHFYNLQDGKKWYLYGVDAQARCIEWMRQYFPNDFVLSTVSTVPHLPFRDNSFDVIYGVSVFTHIKYLWDAWILELKRIVRPGGLLIQTHHCEPAWDFYRDNWDLDWVNRNLPIEVSQHAEIPGRYLLYGDVSVSQTFWKEATIRDYWGRYVEILDVLPPAGRWISELGDM
jgi:SAM-dependent methyltransferase